MCVLVVLVQAEAAQQQENSLEALTTAVAEAKAKEDEAERTRAQERYTPNPLCPHAALSLQPSLSWRPLTAGPFLSQGCGRQ